MRRSYSEKSTLCGATGVPGVALAGDRSRRHSSDAAVFRERTYDVYEPEDLDGWPNQVLGPHPLHRFWTLCNGNAAPALLKDPSEASSDTGSTSATSTSGPVVAPPPSTSTRERSMPRQGSLAGRAKYVPPHLKAMDREAREAAIAPASRKARTFQRPEERGAHQQPRPTPLQVSAAPWERAAHMDEATSSACSEGNTATGTVATVNVLSADAHKPCPDQHHSAAALLGRATQRTRPFSSKAQGACGGEVNYLELKSLGYPLPPGPLPPGPVNPQVSSASWGQAVQVYRADSKRMPHAARGTRLGGIVWQRSHFEDVTRRRNFG